MNLPSEDDPILKSEDPDYDNSMYSTGVHDIEETTRRFEQYSNVESVIAVGSNGFIFRYRN